MRSGGQRLGAAAEATSTGRAPGAGRATSAILAGILVVALLDQTSSADVPPYGPNAAEHASDRALVTSIERRLPAGAMVFQLPVVPFPEADRPGRMKDYDHLVGYLHSRRLRWSYGGIEGSRGGLAEALDGQPADLLLERLAAAGFDGLTVDRFGYADGASGLDRELGRLAGPPAVNPNGRLSFFDLTAYRGALRRRQPADSLAALADVTLWPVLGSPALVSITAGPTARASG